jgi:methyl-accepting chemotaxis protein
LIAPDRQMRIAMVSVTVGLVFLFGFFGFQLWVFSNLLLSLSPLIPETSNLEGMIAGSVKWAWIGFFVSAACFAFVLTTVTIVVSHRVYGPVFAIRKHVSALAKGDFGHRTQLREKDEFKDLAADLNQLSTLLQERNDAV